MASGRMEFHAQSIMQHTNFTFVLPNDVHVPDIKDLRHYDRPTKSLILLHGLTGTDTDWLYGGVAQDMAVQYNLAVFMPTTGNSFYLDRGYPGGNYCEFIGKELPDYIRKVFGFCESRENTMIAGLSMGGFGALHVSLSYPDTFSGCIALSSALICKELAEKGRRKDDPIPPAMTRDIFGDTMNILKSDRNPEYQYQMLKEQGKPIPEIYMAIGTEDSLYEGNVDFSKFLKEQKADFLFEDGPGKHDWKFWNEYIDRGLGWLLR